MTTPSFSVICATLLRASYSSLVRSVIGQTLPAREFVSSSEKGIGVNEYTVRNKLARMAAGDWLVFVDDDSVLRPGHLARIALDIERNPDLVAVSGAIEGNLNGAGQVRFDAPGMWVGATLAARRDIFLEHPFEETWGLPYVPKGWRTDSDWGLRIEQVHPDRWLHDPQLTVDHPGPMGSSFQPDVEERFFQRHREVYLKRFAPVAPRDLKFIYDTQELDPEERQRLETIYEDLMRRVPGLPPLDGASAKSRLKPKGS